MSLLLEDLAEETSAGNRRAAQRLDAEARDLAAPAQAADLGRKALESATQATDHALARLGLAEGVWQSVLEALRREPTGPDAERLLRSVLEVFASERQVVLSARALWDLAGEPGANGTRRAELGSAEQRLDEMAADATRALEHRTRPWQPADPGRLAAGLQLARDGKAVSGDEARARFSKAGG
jgi:hypothetical protein